MYKLTEIFCVSTYSGIFGHHLMCESIGIFFRVYEILNPLSTVDVLINCFCFGASA